MPVTSASPADSRSAAVFDFLPALARRHLAGRAGLRGTVQVAIGAAGVITLTHQYRQGCGAELVEVRIAQLRATSEGSDSYQLYWKNGTGRWTVYCRHHAAGDQQAAHSAAENQQAAHGAVANQEAAHGEGGEAFIGSIDDCLCEIARDPAGCYWS